MRIPKKALLLFAAGAAIVALATSSGAAGQPTKPKMPDVQATVDAARAGKLPKAAVQAAPSSIGVWNGCQFVFLKSNVTSYNTADGSVVEVVDPPELMPARAAACIERTPTKAEISAMEAQLNNINAGRRPPGAPAPPPLPPPRS